MKGIRKNIGDIIFKTDTPLAKGFDVVLLISILLSVIVVFLDSVPSLHLKHGKALFIGEWIFTVLFTIEYLLRIYSARKRLKYLFSFYGIIDLLAILPSYISIIFIGTQYLIVIRILRLLRIFRILKLDRYVGASHHLVSSIKSSRHKIMVFLAAVLTVVVIMGAVMYLIEGPENGFHSIPESIYWAIVTLTTVGYGDISPHTVTGKIIASMIMILGYSIIAVPTGIITAELTRAQPTRKSLSCDNCGTQDLDTDSKYCKNCGKEVG